jgi:hypothetical protein
MDHFLARAGRVPTAAAGEGLAPMKGCMRPALAPIEKAHLSGPICVWSAIEQCQTHG